MRGRNDLKKFWKSTPAEYKDYLFIYLWGGIWAVLNLIQPRLIGGDQIDAFGIYAGRFWALITIIGAVLAVLGLVRKDNLLLERAGVNLLMVGPVAYSAVMFGELIFRFVDPTVEEVGSSWRVLTVAVFALWPFLFLNKRRRQLKSRVKLVSEIPLPDEDASK